MPKELDLDTPPNGSASLLGKWWGFAVRFPHRIVLVSFGIAIVLLLLILFRGLLQARDRDIESLQQTQRMRVQAIDALLNLEAERLRSLRNYAEHLLRLQQIGPLHPDADLLQAFERRHAETWTLPSDGDAAVIGVGEAQVKGLDGFARNDAELMQGLDVARAMSHLLGATPAGSTLQRRMTYVSRNGFVVSRPSIGEGQVLAMLRRHAAAAYFRDSASCAGRNRMPTWALAEASDGSGDQSLFLSLPVCLDQLFRGVVVSEIARRSLDDLLGSTPRDGVRSFLVDRDGGLVGASARNVSRGETLAGVLGEGLETGTMARLFDADAGILQPSDGSRLIFRRLADSDLVMIGVVSTREVILRSAARLSGAVGAGAAALALLLCLTLMVVHTLFGHYLARGEALRALAETDALTGLANRRVFTARFALEYAHGAREQMPIALIMLDIDHFKRINDHWGHASGDIVLRQVAQVLRTRVRSVDLAARLGGEEFAILLPRTGAADAAAVAEQLRQAMGELSCEPAADATAKGNIRFTASFGVAQIVPDGTNDLDSLVLVADQRLYAAKSGGRNRVVAQ
ncbi:diguanylate cyclase [Cupriavidus sp. NPDC089707]|uniref:diguanylate cyclase n=1 Tax=Cupriavidus sp. NPDC089707 TaxID=3363963 RepID=UPI003828A17D